jgi:hypothetical protein
MDIVGKFLHAGFRKKEIILHPEELIAVLWFGRLHLRKKKGRSCKVLEFVSLVIERIKGQLRIFLTI